MRRPVFTVGLLLLLVVQGASAQQGPLPRNQLLQFQSLVNKLQGHLNICLQDAAREEALRAEAQQELEAVKRQLEEQKKTLADPQMKKGGE